MGSLSKRYITYDRSQRDVVISKIRKEMSKSGNESVFITFSDKTVVLIVEIDVAQ